MSETTIPLPESATTSVRYAGFWVRLLAMLIDGLIITIGCAILQTVLGIEMVTFTDQYGNNGPHFNAVGSLLALIYYVATTGSSLQGTLGKKLLGIKVVRSDMSKITYLRTTGRWFAYLLSGIPLMVGYFMAGFMKEKQALHDLACDTRVIYR